MQKRSAFSHEGGTWSIPGGARQPGESALEAALREAREEVGLDARDLTMHGVHRSDHRTWSYTTVIVTVPMAPSVSLVSESEELRWVPLTEAGTLALHPGFASSLPDLLLPRLHLVVDAANVVGSRPNGWWRDRAGAAAGLLDQLAGLVGKPVPAAVGSRTGPGLVVAIDVILEGAARGPHGELPRDGIRVTQADYGDDAIVAVAGEMSARSRGGLDPDQPVLVAVTSDRELRLRLADEGAECVGPSWLLSAAVP